MGLIILRCKHYIINILYLNLASSQYSTIYDSAFFKSIADSMGEKCGIRLLQIKSCYVEFSISDTFLVAINIDLTRRYS